MSDALAAVLATLPSTTDDDCATGEAGEECVSLNFMDRRTMLSGGVTALTISLTGCSAALPETGPEYEEDDDIPSFPTEALEGDG